MFNTKKLITLEGTSRTNQSNLSKLTNQVQKLSSELQSTKDKIENKLKEVHQENDDQIDLLENLTKFLLDKEGLRLYKLKEENKGGHWFTVYATPFMTTSTKSWEDEPLYEEIDIDELKTLGNYTTITVGTQTYFIAKRKVEKKAKKSKKSKKSKK